MDISKFSDFLFAMSAVCKDENITEQNKNKTQRNTNFDTSLPPPPPQKKIKQVKNDSANIIYIKRSIYLRIKVLVIDLDLPFAVTNVVPIFSSGFLLVWAGFGGGRILAIFCHTTRPTPHGDT